MDVFLAQAETGNALSHFAELAKSNAWQYLLPEIGLAGLAMVILVLELALPKGLRHLVVNVVLVGLLALIAGASANLNPELSGSSVELFGGLLRQSYGMFAEGLPSTAFLRVFFLAAAFFVVWLGAGFLRRRNLSITEFLHIVLVVTAAMLLLVQSNHFVLLFVALETITVGFYVLVGYNRTSSASLEAGVKYLVLGGLSSALLLFGIVLLYGAAGNPVLNGGETGDAMNFAFLQSVVEANLTNPLILAGISLVIGGIAFKIGMFPFQVWVPDVYQGAPTPTTAFLAVASKGAGMFTLLILLAGPFAPAVGSGTVPGPLYWLLAVMTGATLLFSNLTALGQTNVKRLMGLSGISHAGFLLLGVLAGLTGEPLAASAIVVYLAAYLVGGFATFGVMVEMTGKNDSEQDTGDYQLLLRRNPFLAGVLGCGVGSLAGIPPSLGFVAKFLIIYAALQAGLWCLATIALLCVGAGVYYYFGWLREAFLRTEVSEEKARDLARPIAVPFFSKLILSVLAAILVLGGIWQSFLVVFF